MSVSPTIGIHGIGVFLPDAIRDNTWWPPETVERWRANDARQGLPSLDLAGSKLGIRMVLEAVRAGASDPFRGTHRRHILDPQLRTTDMEIAAAQDALARCGMQAKEIDLLLVYSAVPDFLATNSACTLHRALGLPSTSIALSLEGACNSFQLQLELARRMIGGGAARNALLVQSSALSRVMPWDESYSAWFGDAATAVVVGPASGERGLLAQSHRTDGAFADGLVVGIPKARWYEAGKNVAYYHDAMGATRLLAATADMGHEVITDALAKAGHAPADVAFFACHQGVEWLRRVTQAYCGLTNAKTVDTFPWASSVSAANVPLVLSQGERTGLLRAGDLVTLFSGGSGITFSSTVLRWGA